MLQAPYLFAYEKIFVFIIHKIEMEMFTIQRKKLEWW